MLARTLGSVVRTDPGAVASLLPELRWALRARRPLPPEVERALRVLAGQNVCW